MKVLFFLLLILPGLLLSQTIDLFYTADGKTIETIRGYKINKDLTLVEEADESWLFVAGHQIGPNGYMAKQSRVTLGTFGKKTAKFIPASNFLGIGKNRRYERSISIGDIAYILPNPKPFEPLLVRLVDGTDWEMFVAGEYTECVGQKVVAGKPDNSIFIVKLKHTVSKSQRTHTTRPRQLGVKAKAISFSEQALKKAIRRGKIR